MHDMFGAKMRQDAIPTAGGGATYQTCQITPPLKIPIPIHISTPEQPPTVHEGEPVR